MKVTAIGVDIAKHVFQVHGADKGGKAILRRKLRRSEVGNFSAGLEPCLLGMGPAEVHIIGPEF